ncbi:hypothetical protein C1H46_001646 [Malus baccata]|uniref:RRM domain-containing protein n=1 Tax=Malus baccata TaxID=106549 RepID=A0A540NQ86_MALBA|nr:hypothetical protein C1H46_001646 [Malus baccata]
MVLHSLRRGGPPMVRLVMTRNLPLTVTEDEIEEEFKNFGQIIHDEGWQANTPQVQPTFAFSDEAKSGRFLGKPSRARFELICPSRYVLNLHQNMHGVHEYDPKQRMETIHEYKPKQRLETI